MCQNLLKSETKTPFFYLCVVKKDTESEHEIARWISNSVHQSPRSTISCACVAHEFISAACSDLIEMDTMDVMKRPCSGNPSLTPHLTQAQQTICFD